MRSLMIIFAAMFLLSGVAEAKPKGGPPPWAPAHGARAKHRYHYYPAAQVYFDLDRRVYFSLRGGSWSMMAALPVGIMLGASVSMELDTPEPYRFHSEHVRAYPPGQAKKAAGGKGLGKKGKKK